MAGLANGSAFPVCKETAVGARVLGEKVRSPGGAHVDGVVSLSFIVLLCLWKFVCNLIVMSRCDSVVLACHPQHSMYSAVPISR